MHLCHPPGVGTCPGDYTLGRDGLGERALNEAVVRYQRADQTAADKSDGRLGSVLHPIARAPQSSPVVASVQRLSSARSAWTFRQTANALSPSKASTSSFFTVVIPSGFSPGSGLLRSPG